MNAPFRLADWEVRPQLDRISGPAGDVHLQPKAMRVLVYLAWRAPDVVTKEQLFQDVWEGTFVSDEALTYVIWELRKALGDDAKRPRFIETIPKRGYRLIGSPCFEESPPADELNVRSRVRGHRGGGLLLGALGLVLGVGLAASYWGRDGRLPVVRFRERDWVLVANFDNRTGEALFDGSLHHAFEREVMRSAFVNVAPRERIEDTLRLMRRPLGTRVDLALAREIALRDGAIRAILGGHIEKHAGGYLVTVQLVDPPSGATVSSPSARAGTEAEVLQSLPQLSDRIRQVLGEELPADPGRPPPLRRASTRSLRALQLFSQAMVFVDEEKWSPASELLKRAVNEDPEFASAHIYLAHSYSNLGGQEARPHYEKAFALADGLPDRERYFILGTYYARFLRDDEKAVQAFEILTRLHPDDYWAAHKLANAYHRLGRYGAATAHRLRAADLRPNSFLVNLSAAFYLRGYGGSRVTHSRYFQRAQALVTPEVAAEMPEEVAELEFLPAAEYWLSGDLAQARKEVERMARSTPSQSGPVQRYLVENVGRAYLSLGMIRAAESRFGAVPDEARRSYLLAQVALARGDERSFGRYMSGIGIASHIRTHWLDASALVLSGDTGILSQARAERVASALEAMQNDSPPDTLPGFVREFRTAARGEILLARGRVAEAIPLLEQAVEQLRPRPRPVFFLAVESLANAWEQRGHRARALQILQEAAQCKSLAFDDGLFRMRVQLRLAALSRSLGHLREAREVETELRRLLVYADPDHAILQGLERLSEKFKVGDAGVSPQG